MCRRTTTQQPSSSANKTRQICYALTSFALGAWAFYKVNAISGPAFEPILGACTNPDFTSATEFAKKTGYHLYEPKLGLGLGAFNVLVCLITQFLLELRETYPAGLLTWGGVIVVSLPATLLSVTTSGRRDVKGPVRYPTILGLLYQLFGVSVMFPLVFNPSYIFSGAKFGVPVTRMRGKLTKKKMCFIKSTRVSYLFHAELTHSF